MPTSTWPSSAGVQRVRSRLSFGQNRAYESGKCILIVISRESRADTWNANQVNAGLDFQSQTRSGGPGHWLGTLGYDHRPVRGWSWMTEARFSRQQATGTGGSSLVGGPRTTVLAVGFVLGLLGIGLGFLAGVAFGFDLAVDDDLCAVPLLDRLDGLLPATPPEVPLPEDEQPVGPGEQVARAIRDLQGLPAVDALQVRIADLELLPELRRGFAWLQRIREECARLDQEGEDLRADPVGPQPADEASAVDLHQHRHERAIALRELRVALTEAGEVEVGGTDLTSARRALNRISHKLPVKVKLLQRKKAL